MHNDGQELRRWQVLCELLFAVLAFVNLGFYYFHLTGALSGEQLRLARWVDLATIAVFGADYLVRFVRAEDKRSFFRANLLDLVALIPLSPLFRGARLVRCVYFFVRSFRRLRELSVGNLFLYVFFGMVAILFTSALLIGPLEGMSFFEGVWWGVVTIATVGYGDFVPVSAAGRVIAMLLMFTGIGFLSFLTSTVTSHYVTKRLEQQGDAASRGLLRHYRQQLLSFEEMTDEDIDDMHRALKALKAKESEKREKEPEHD